MTNIIVAFYLNDSLYLERKYAPIFLSTNIVCSKMRTVLLERRSRKTVKFEEQIMSKDKSARIRAYKIKSMNRNKILRV